MATVSKMRKLINPGRKRWSAERKIGAKRKAVLIAKHKRTGKRVSFRFNPTKRKLSPLQKLFFGSKRQRAAVKANRGRKRNAGPFSIRKTKKHFKRQGWKSTSILTGKKTRGLYQLKRKGRKRNVSSIVTVWPAGHPNPGRKRRKRNSKRVVVINKGAKMARTRKRNRKSVARRRVNRSRRRNYGTRTGRSRSSYRLSGALGSGRGGSRRKGNPGRRRRNVSHRRHYRRNPGILVGTAGRILGVLGGVAATKLLMGFVPTTFSTGVIGYLATGVVAFAQGQAVGKISKNAALGNDFMVGGLAYLVAKVLNDYFPSIGGYTGISGMGLIGGSNFYVPQVNQAGSMGSFMVPQAVTGAMPQMNTTSGNLGRLRRTGRLM